MQYALWIVLFFISMTANALSLRADAPARYVVQPGDSLWRIACQYLTQPWEWKALWHANPQIKNPNRLYPGAVIELHHARQKPYLKVLTNGTIKLSPHMRPMPIENAVPLIPLSDIQPFLDASVVLDRDTLTDAPYIVSFTTEHMLGGQGDEAYVKGLCPKRPPPGSTFSYGLYRPRGVYIDPVTKLCLGYKARLVGYAELISGGDPAKIMLTDILQSVKRMDKVMPNNYPDFELNFLPKTPAVVVSGLIIDLPGDYTQGAEGLVVVINRGKDARLEPGDVLGVYAKCYPAPDPKCPECVTIPPERIGEVLVFRTFTHTSFALVVRSIRAIHKMDTVTNP